NLISDGIVPVRPLEVKAINITGGFRFFNYLCILTRHAVPAGGGDDVWHLIKDSEQISRGSAAG
ncbi:MAG: hypothetical protein U9P14_02085, partial [Gemmatimonadota bacterium]|nr:hypothetical protein [Gemmatimonadota bacterium]